MHNCKYEIYLKKDIITKMYMNKPNGLLFLDLYKLSIKKEDVLNYVLSKNMVVILIINFLQCVLTIAICNIFAIFYIITSKFYIFTFIQYNLFSIFCSINSLIFAPILEKNTSLIICNLYSCIWNMDIQIYIFSVHFSCVIFHIINICMWRRYLWC